MLHPITTFDITVKFENDLPIHQSMGSVFHGIIMQHIDTTYATELHRSQVHPYRQFIFFDERTKSYIWRIITFTETCESQMRHMMQALPESVYVRQKQMHLKILHISASTTSHDALCELILGPNLDEPAEIHELKLLFTTCTSFKSQDAYQPFPDLERIFQSLLKRWNTFSNTYTFTSPGLAKELCKATTLVDYQVKFKPYRVERTQIPAFIGHYTVRFKKNHSLAPLAMLLLFYSQFTGVGIKTSLGMGGIHVITKS